MSQIIKKILRGHSLNPHPSLVFIYKDQNIFVNSSLEYLRYLPKFPATSLPTQTTMTILLTSFNPSPWTYTHLHINIVNFYVMKCYNLKYCFA